MKTKKSETKVMTKQDITTFLKKTIAVVANKNAELAKQVDYALTHLKKATKADLEELLTEVELCLATPVAENQTKPKVLEEEEVDSEVVVDGEDEEDEVEEEKPKKKIKKSTKAKTEKTEEDEPPKKSKLSKNKKTVEEAPVLSKKSKLPTAKIFPDTIDHEDLGKLKAVPDKYHDYEDLKEALNDGKEIYFACYWTPRHIKEYNYGAVNMVIAPKKFPDDLDLLMACVPCENVERVWCMSQYTEAMFFFDGSDLEPIEDTDLKTGEKFKIRVSNGMEYELYEPVED